jgi:2-polyprenyl-6-methoxyphenol hydroxylase-like FAD-dependent oxidoreductase
MNSPQYWIEGPNWDVKFNPDTSDRAVCNAQGVKLAGPGFPNINGITRTALHHILTSTVKCLGTPVRLGVTVQDWEETPEGVVVRLTDASVQRYRLVVASDGASSAMRRKLFGDQSAASPAFIGLGCWRHNFKRPPELMWGQIWFGPRSKAGLIPLANDLMYMFVLSSEPGNPHHSSDVLHDLMKDRLTGFGGLMGELRDSRRLKRGLSPRPRPPRSTHLASGSRCVDR